MKTKEEITQIIANKLYDKHYSALVFGDLTAYVGGLGEQGKAKLLDAILTGKDADVGEFLRSGMVATAEANALAEATTMMADDSLSLAEMQAIF